MGFNSTVVVYNDALHDIEQHGDEFAANLVSAILRVGAGREETVDVPCGCHANAAIVVDSHHADQQVAMIVGGNLGQRIGRGYAGHWSLNMSKAEDRLKVLRTLAEAEGYTLRKKPQRR